MWAILLKSKLIKAGAATVGGSGAVAFVVAFANTKDASMREYVDLKHEAAVAQIQNLDKGQERILSVLEKIDERLYLINQRSK